TSSPNTAAKGTANGDNTDKSDIFCSQCIQNKNKPAQSESAPDLCGKSGDHVAQIKQRQIHGDQKRADDQA
ncbi:hypothetical protein, partial [Neisseria meningitidis]|uniref:hypothetical protein n=1 Tax=Neisseria meningitidis TaxID=487 RepID=UPI001C84D4E1